MRSKPFKFALSGLIVGILAILFYLRNVSESPLTAYNDAAFLHAIPTHLIPNQPPDNLLLYPPLHTHGRHLLDAQNQSFTLASVNWYGASDELFIPSGLDIQHRSNISSSIRQLGFNSVRLPYSDEMVNLNPPIPSHLLAANPDLQGLRALDIFTAVVTSLTDAGIVVIPNNHITQATWCCGINPCDAAWRNDYVSLGMGKVCRVSQSEEQWIENWEAVMKPLVNDSLVVGVDLRNEVRGLWGTMSWGRWADAAERAGDRLGRLKKDWVVVVGGMGSGNDLRGVRDRPVVLNLPGKVIYEAHVYAWSGWGSLGGSYSKRGYESFRESMRDNWGWLLEENVAPVWVGEFGAPRAPAGEGDRNYWGNLMRYLGEVKEGGEIGFGYWALNPRKPHENEDEAYGLIQDDWEGLVWDYRMRDMRLLMAN